jgi:hypothetical protein
LCAALSGCTTISAAKVKGSPFDGAWSVEWCDRSRPEVDCGGFHLDLVQNGSKLCGTYNGARVGLSQVDEDGEASGTATGESAVLSVESQRSGAKYAAHAVIRGSQLHWKLGETLRRGDQDIDIIAFDAKLERRPLEGDLALRHAETASDCQARWDKR